MFSFTEIDFGTIGEVQKVNMARLETVYGISSTAQYTQCKRVSVQNDKKSLKRPQLVHSKCDREYILLRTFYAGTANYSKDPEGNNT